MPIHSAKINREIQQIRYLRQCNFTDKEIQEQLDITYGKFLRRKQWLDENEGNDSVNISSIVLFERDILFTINLVKGKLKEVNGDTQALTDLARLLIELHTALMKPRANGTLPDSKPSTEASQDKKSVDRAEEERKITELLEKEKDGCKGNPNIGEAETGDSARTD